MAKELVNTKNAPAAIGPYSQGIKIGNLFYSSGQLPADPVSGDIVAGGINEQATRSFENVKAVLEAAGSSLDKVVKVNVFMQDLKDFVPMNELYAKYFTEPFPARSCVQVAALPKGALIEVEVIAEV